ncbi:MAG: [FeFe] hydrogenase H-cluster maturation GTPase HydF [Eubacteriales bacterium]|jgi:[FeFe] hydrogenase H-cluster maturation GTPase HydF|nr:[FeFe] hydrogenase H-cluster maturation GTPase HydF [Clostridiales bacterium]
MGLNNTPTADRLHIGIFGRRNAGKSSVINAITGQELAVVSDIKGTTTDPVYKAMELLPLGPVMIIDTPGIDDEGQLGSLRVKKARQVLNKTDVAVIVVDATEGRSSEDDELVNLIREKNIPYIIAYNKCELLDNIPQPSRDEIYISTAANIGINELKERIAAIADTGAAKQRIVGDLISPSDIVVLVTPIDKSAPKGRLILPQQQTIRDILDSDAIAVVTKEIQLRETLETLNRKPKLVVTDSQVFDKAAADTPPDVPLTSFSILFARYKGLLDEAVRGAAAIDRLRDGDTVLICEGCTHHRQCDDIGTVKLPRWLRNYTGRELHFEFTSGGDFPDDLSKFALILHCGGCMLNEREVRYRMKCAGDQNVPITNYGVAIAYMQGILRRSVAMFPHLAAMLDESAQASK